MDVPEIPNADAITLFTLRFTHISKVLFLTGSPSIDIS